MQDKCIYLRDTSRERFCFISTRKILDGAACMQIHRHKCLRVALLFQNEGKSKTGHVVTACATIGSCVVDKVCQSCSENLYFFPPPACSCYKTLTNTQDRSQNIYNTVHHLWMLQNVHKHTGSFTKHL